MRNDTVVLRVDDVVKHLGGQRILDGVSLTVKKGRLKVLIGPSGAGKSTLLQCINFLLPPDEGKVFLDGREIHGKNRSAWA
jgi:polar amino acid transport system ATP-binding protein